VKIVETNDLVRLEREIWGIPTSFSDDMRVPARLYADESLLEDAPWVGARERARTS